MLLLLLLLSLFIPHPAFAQTTPANTVSVSPSIARLDLQTDKPQVDLTYTNTTDKTIELSLNASDFTELEDGYKLSYLESKDAKNYQYALSSWIDFSKTSLILKPQEKDTVTVFINRNQLTPGGHYGAILAQMSNETPNGALQITGVLSSLIFVRTATGKETEEGSVERFAPERDWIDNPDSFVIRFHNTGDTDLTPYGLITIRDMFGRQTGNAILNDGSLITLPESIRRYDIHIQQTTPFLLPGMYTASLALHFGKTNKHIATTTNYFSQGSIPLIPIVSVILLAILTLGYLRKKRSKTHRAD